MNTRKTTGEAVPDILVYLSDLAVFHKYYNVNRFPFSTSEKAVTERKLDYFQTVKLTLKHYMEQAKKGGKVQIR